MCACTEGHSMNNDLCTPILIIMASVQSHMGDLQVLLTEEGGIGCINRIWNVILLSPQKTYLWSRCF